MLLSYLRPLTFPENYIWEKKALKSLSLGSCSTAEPHCHLVLIMRKSDFAADRLLNTPGLSKTAQLLRKRNRIFRIPMDLCKHLEKPQVAVR